METFFSKYKKLLPPLFLVILEFFLFFTNYKPGTYLVGWDNVMPEFNLQLNLTRALTAVWQDYRGLGTLDGMAHAANLFHTLYIAIFNALFDQNLLRYLYIHGTHLLGGVAFYYLALKLLKHKYSALIASLFYMLNIGIIQMYYAPLEVFATHFAALPILGLLIYRYIEKKSTSSLLLFALLSLATSAQGFVPTIFIVYLIFVFFILIFKFKKLKLKGVFLIILTIFITNAFWMLPFGFSALHKSGEIKETRINEFSSEEIYYLNHARGSISNVMTLNGFMLDTVELNTSNYKNEYFMQAWRDNQNDFGIKIFSIITSLITLFGIFLTLKNKFKSLYPFVAIFGASFFFLANDAPVLQQLNELIRNFIPFFGEAFRFPFTKFITLFAFSYALFFSFGASYLVKLALDLIRSVEKRFSDVSDDLKLIVFQNLYFVFYGIVALAVLNQAAPAFSGNFTAPFLRLKVPQMYLETFSYFKKEDPNGRILTMPMSTFWNWQYKSWGHRGSGFLWYGIAQPMIDRAFDPWSKYNEQLFNEISYTLTQNNIEKFDGLIEKYDISYVLLDENVLNTLSAKPIDYIMLEEFLGKSKTVSLDKKFDKILIYKSKEKVNPIYSFNALPSVDTAFVQGNEDIQHEKLGNYINDPKSPDIILPFPSLSTLKLTEDTDFKWERKDNKLIFSSKKTIDNAKDYILEIPSIFEKEFFIPVNIEVKDGSIYLNIEDPEIKINGQSVNLQRDPLILNPQVVKNPNFVSFLDIGNTIEVGKNNESYLINNLLNTIKLSDGQNEEFIQFDTSRFAKDKITVELPEKISTFEVSQNLFSSTLSSENIVKNGKYIIVKGSDSNEFLKEERKTDIKKSDKGIELMAKSDSISVDYYQKELFHQGTYAIISKTKYKDGLPINFYVDSPLKAKSEIETKLDKKIEESIIILPATDDYQRGYGFHFGVKSIGKETASSIINEVNIYPINSNTITDITLIKKQQNPESIIKTQKLPVEFSQIGKFFYDVKAVPNSIITLSQSYDKNFVAYQISNPNIIKKLFPFIFGKKLDQHTQVNNWANAWKIESAPKNSRIILIYMPQNLEYLGILILLLSPLLFLTSKNFFKLNKFNHFLESKTESLKHKIKENIV